MYAASKMDTKSRILGVEIRRRDRIFEYLNTIRIISSMIKIKKIFMKSFLYASIFQRLLWISIQVWSKIGFVLNKKKGGQERNSDY